MISWIQATWRSCGTANECCPLGHSSCQVIEKLSLHPDSFLGIQTGFLSYSMATNHLSTVCSYLEPEQVCDIVGDWSDEPDLGQAVDSFPLLWWLITGTFKRAFWWFPIGLIWNLYVAKVEPVLLGFWICKDVLAAFPGCLWAGFVICILCWKVLENIKVSDMCSAGIIFWLYWQFCSLYAIKLKII